jgi:hypothetical protein
MNKSQLTRAWLISPALQPPMENMLQPLSDKLLGNALMAACVAAMATPLAVSPEITSFNDVWFGVAMTNSMDGQSVTASCGSMGATGSTVVFKNVTELIAVGAARSTMHLTVTEHSEPDEF